MTCAKTHPIARGTVSALCIMLVLFPKGGLRIAGLPLTWGYVLLFVSLIGLMPYRMLAVRARFVHRQIAAMLCLVPILLLMIYSALAYGVGDNYNGLISTGIGLIFMPMMFLWFYPPMMPIVDGQRMMRIISRCILIAALFGIFLFIWKPITGNFLQIPYLTVNADDLADFDASKNISRGLVSKLISTYNNGNLYGAATLILLRLFDHFSPERWKRWTMRVALVLTLSRTIWASMIFDQLLGLGVLLYRQRQIFPRLRLKRVVLSIALLGLCVPVFILLVQLIGYGDRAFLLDPTLGGRTGQFQQIGASPWLPAFPSQFMFAEIIYLSAVTLYGKVGLPAIALVFLSPFLILAFDQTALKDPIRSAALRGLILYAFICTSDGALGLIPVMAFYWFTYMIFLFGVPGMRDAYPTPAPRAPRPPLSIGPDTIATPEPVSSAYGDPICL